MSTQRTRAEHVDAAVAAARRWGLAEPSLGVSARAVAAALGVTRSAVYREWQTVADLNDDCLRFVLFAAGWPARVVERPADGSVLGAAIVEVLDHPADDLSCLARAFVSAFPPESAPRRELVAGERRWLDGFAAWLHGHLEAAGRGHVAGSTDLVLAVTVTALVEGSLLTAALEEGLAPSPQVQDRDAGLACSIDRLVEVMTRPNAVTRHSLPTVAPTAPGIVPAPRPPVVCSPTRPLAAQLRQLVEQAMSESFEGLDAPVVPRLVDMGRLATEIGVSERRLFTVWPTAADLNADVVVGLLSAVRAETEAVAAEALRIGLRRPWSGYRELVISGMDAAVRAGAADPQGSYRMGVLAALDPTVRSAAATVIGAWRRSMEVTLLAMLAMTGRHSREGVSMGEYAAVVFRSMAGAHRLAALHGDLLDATVAVDGREEPLFGLASSFVLSSLTTLAPVTAGAGTAPPLA